MPYGNLNIIAVTGSGGGSGVTTVAAQLAAALTLHQQPCIAIDASPRNALRLHFGMTWEDEAGLSTQVLSGLPWNEAAFRSPSGTDFIPIGNAAQDFDAWLTSHPGWFGKRMAEIDQQEGFVICDCPDRRGALGSQILSASRLALVVLSPDALSYATAERTRQEALSAGAAGAFFVVNKFDPTRMLDRDLEALIHADFKEDCLPMLIHRDESVREALANKKTVLDYAPSCQAASDFSALATWLIAHCAREREEAA